jgi:hypothetical protein
MMRNSRIAVMALVLGAALPACSHKSQKHESPIEAAVKDVAAGALLATGSGIPITDRTTYVEGSTQIEGKAFLTDELGPRPASMTQVVLQKNKTILARAMATSDGSFRFSVRIPDGEYVIRADSDTYSGHVDFELKGLRARDVDLFLSVKKP